MSAIPRSNSMPEPGIDAGQPGPRPGPSLSGASGPTTPSGRPPIGRYLSPVVKLVAGERQSTRAWDQGGRGEERVGRLLSKAVGLDGVVLHDRSIPGRSSNIDHIAIVPSGVWVIDTKQYTGRVQQRDLGGWFVSRPSPLCQRTQSLVPHRRGAAAGRLGGASREVGWY